MITYNSNTETEAVTLPCRVCGGPNLKVVRISRASYWKKVGHFQGKCDECNRIAREIVNREKRRANALDLAKQARLLQRDRHQSKHIAVKLVAESRQHAAKEIYFGACLVCRRRGAGAVETKLRRWPWCAPHRKQVEKMAAQGGR